MYRRFTGITMQHLINKYIVSVMTVVLMSCSHIEHIVYDGNDISESPEKEIYFEGYSKSPHSKKDKYKQIYCTPEDKKKGIKDTIDFLHVACGRSKIQPIKNRTLEIERIFLGAKQMPSGDMLLGHHLLFLKDGDKVLQKIQVEKESYDPFWREVVFVKIREDVYWQDLNDDGKLEFAVLKTDTGYSSHRTADIYTLEADTFQFYGHGVYVWTTGEHVLLNCPKDCGHNNHDACSQCL